MSFAPITHLLVDPNADRSGAVRAITIEEMGDHALVTHTYGIGCAPYTNATQLLVEESAVEVSGYVAKFGEMRMWAFTELTGYE